MTGRLNKMDSPQTLTVLELLNLDLDLQEQEALCLRCIAGRQGLTREIKKPNVNRPGLSMSGFFNNFAFDRIQLFGRGEHAFMEKIHNDPEYADKTKHLEALFNANIPCAVLPHDFKPSKEMFDLAEKTGTPLLQTPLTTSEFTFRAMIALDTLFARTTITHGVLVEVFGIGIFITGESGVGKSESALELIHRGHRIVADDTVEIRNVSGNALLGSAADKILGHHMEIRGLGIINVAHLFGVGAIRDKKQIQLVVELEQWDFDKEYDRIGIDERKKEILGIKVPYLIVPIKPGRNIPIIIETAAMNERLKKMGYHSAKDFNRSNVKWLER